MKTVIDDSTVQLVGGLIDAVSSLVLALEAHGAIDRETLAYIIEHRLDHEPDDALHAAPLAILLQWLRPNTPPRPQLRLIHGGKV